MVSSWFQAVASALNTKINAKKELAAKEREGGDNKISSAAANTTSELGGNLTFLVARKFALDPVHTNEVAPFKDAYEQHKQKQQTGEPLAPLADETIAILDNLVNVIIEWFGAQTQTELQSARMQACYIDTLVSKHTLALDDKEAFDDLITPIAKLFQNSNNQDLPDPSDVLARITSVADTYTMNKYTWLVNDGTHQDDENALLHVLCTTDKLCAQFFSASHDGRMKKIEYLVSSVCAFRLTSALIQHDVAQVWKHVVEQGVTLADDLFAVQSHHLQTVSVLLHIQMSEMGAVREWMKEHSKNVARVALNTWQFIRYTQQLQESLEENALQIEKCKETLSVILVSLNNDNNNNNNNISDPPNMDIQREILDEIDKICLVSKHIEHLKHMKMNLSAFLLAAEAKQMMVDYEKTMQAAGVERQETEWKTMAEMLHHFNNITKSSKSCFNSLNASDRRKHQRSKIMKNKERHHQQSPTKVVVNVLRLTTVDSKDENALDEDIIAQVQNDQVSLHKAFVNLVRATGTTCPYDRIGLALNGFCAVTMSRTKGLLIPVDQSIGLIKYESTFYGFASVEAGHSFAANPASYLEKIREKCQTSPDLIELANMSTQLPDYSTVSRGIKLDGEIEDVIQAMVRDTIIGNQGDIFSWGCRALTNFAKTGEQARQQLARSKASACVLRALGADPTHKDIVTTASQAVTTLCKNEEFAAQFYDGDCVKELCNILKHNVGDGAKHKDDGNNNSSNNNNNNNHADNNWNNSNDNNSNNNNNNNNSNRINSNNTNNDVNTFDVNNSKSSDDNDNNNNIDGGDNISHMHSPNLTTTTTTTTTNLVHDDNNSRNNNTSSNTNNDSNTNSNTNSNNDSNNNGNSNSSNNNNTDKNANDIGDSEIPSKIPLKTTDFIFCAIAQLCIYENHSFGLAKYNGAVYVCEVVRRCVSENFQVFHSILETIKNCSNFSGDFRVALVEGGVLPYLYLILQSPKYDFVSLKWTCEALERMCITIEIRQEVNKARAALYVLNIMDIHASEPLLQQAACKLIARLAQSMETCLDIISSGGIQKVRRAMETHARDVDTQLYACWALIEIFGGDADAKDLSEIAGEEVDDNDADAIKDKQDIVNIILDSMKKHEKIVDVQRYACKALENLGSRSEEMRAKIAKANAVQIIIKCCRHHSAHAAVQSYALHTLATLAAKDAKMHFHITQIRGLTFALAAMDFHKLDPDVQANGCRLFSNLVLHEEVRNLAFKEDILTRVVTAMKMFPQDTNVNHYALWTLANLCSSAKFRPIIQKEAKKLMHEAIAAMLNDADVQIAAMRGFERLSLNANEQVQPCTREIKLILHSLTAIVDADDVAECAMLVLCTLTTNMVNRDAFVQYDGIDAIVAVGQKRKESAVMCSGLCGLLSNVVFKSARNRASLTRGLAMQTAVFGMTQHLFNVPLQMSACAFIRNYTASNETARIDAVRSGAVPALVNSMVEHLQDEKLCYWVCGALNNLCRGPAAKAIVRAEGIELLCLELMDMAWLGLETKKAVAELLERLQTNKK